MAGYVGSMRAAPILIEMMKREEAIQGGYYTGIATIHEGKIYYAKLVGDVDRLLLLTEAEKLPGNIGIIHSRSKGGGLTNEWSHPFVSEKDGKINSAYIANGGQGFFSSNRDKLCARADELLLMGYNMRSRDRFETRYPTLKDGSCVHMTDLMCQELQYLMDNGRSAPEAMEEAFHELPGELAGLLLTLAEPTSIAWSRTNMPLYISYAPHGTYIASTALAFPADAGKETLLPAQSSGRLYSNKCEITPYAEQIGNMGFINDENSAAAYDIIYNLAKEGKKDCAAFYKAVYKLFAGYDYYDAEPLTYNVMQQLDREGKLECEIVRVPGVIDGITAPLALYSLKN